MKKRNKSDWRKNVKSSNLKDEAKADHSSARYPRLFGMSVLLCPVFRNPLMVGIKQQGNQVTGQAPTSVHFNRSA